MQAAKVMKALYNTLQNGFGPTLDETAQRCEIERRCRQRQRQRQLCMKLLSGVKLKGDAERSTLPHF